MMRIYRDDQPELWEDPPPVFRDDRLRELVDELPSKQRHMVSRVFFGGEHMKTAAAEIGVSAPTGRQIMEDGIARLRRAMQETD